MTDGIKKFSVGTRPELASWTCSSTGEERIEGNASGNSVRTGEGRRETGDDCIKQIALVQEVCLNRM